MQLFKVIYRLNTFSPIFNGVYYWFLGRIRAALMEINFIGNCIRSRESSNAAADEWQYVAMVVGK